MEPFNTRTVYYVIVIDDNKGPSYVYHAAPSLEGAYTKAREAVKEGHENVRIAQLHSLAEQTITFKEYR